MAQPQSLAGRQGIKAESLDMDQKDNPGRLHLAGTQRCCSSQHPQPPPQQGQVGCQEMWFAWSYCSMGNWLSSCSSSVSRIFREYVPKYEVNVAGWAGALCWKTWTSECVQFNPRVCENRCKVAYQVNFSLCGRRDYHIPFVCCALRN